MLAHARGTFTSVFSGWLLWSDGCLTTSPLCQGCEKSRCEDARMPWLTSGLRFPAFSSIFFLLLLSCF